MRHDALEFRRASPVLLVAFGLLVGCGGRESGGGVPTSQSGAGAAGAGGSDSQGGSSGAASVAGAPATSVCSLPMGGTVCDGYAPVFQHNPDTGLCVPTVFGGCGGTRNVFATRQDCESACPGGGANWGACQHDADCTLRRVTCACEPLGEVSFVSLNTQHVADFSATQPDCPACEAVSEYDATGKYYKPVCAAGQCSALDIRKSPATECTTDADCILRDGAACCPGCDGEEIVAVSVAAQLCDVAQPCSACAGQISPDLHAACSDGRCDLRPPLR